MRNALELVQTTGSLRQMALSFCALCFQKNGGNGGTHAVICWFKGKVADDVEPGPGRWNPQGTCLDDLTFVPPGPVSVFLTGEGCKWHGFVKKGDAA